MMKPVRRHPLRHLPYKAVRFAGEVGGVPLYKASPKSTPRSARNALEEAARLYGRNPCYYRVKCRASGADLTPTIDHLVAEAKGGSSGLCNLRLACHACNSDKRDQVARKYRRSGSLPRETKQY